MKRIIHIFLLTIIGLGINGCKKESEDSNSATDKCKLRSFTIGGISSGNYNIFYSDSLFYDEGKLSYVKEYSNLTLHSIYRYEYISNKVNIYRIEDSIEELYRTITFNDGKLSTIIDYQYGERYYRFYYSGDMLSFYTLGYELDDIAYKFSVIYDWTRKNITQLRYYRYMDNLSYELANIDFYMSYDDNENPFNINSSLYFCKFFSNFYDGDMEGIASMFSKNNYLITDYHNFTYNYNSEGYPIEMIDSPFLFKLDYLCNLK